MIDQHTTTPWPQIARGESHHPPCVFLHGWLGQKQDWLPLIQKLQHHYYCVAIDLPGHGQHLHRSVTEPLTFANVIEELHGVLTSLPCSQPPVLIGYSLGGRIALSYALRFPHPLTAIVLENCQPGITDDTERIQRQQADQALAQQLLTQGIDAFVEQWYNLPLFRSLHQHPHLLEPLKTQRKQNSPAWVAKVLQELSPGHQPDGWDTLSSLTTRTLLISGALDPKYPKLCQDMHHRITYSECRIVEGAGHNVHLEKPEDWLTHVSGFLATVWNT